jgi:2,4-dienoyl-CoA reductase-like NADH-dependent reductase (Old Yellow Enzyme family)/thioredoxin reductase
MNRFSKLFSPIRIGRLEVKNRLVFAPMSCELANLDGSVSPEMLAYYEERARGGAGLVIVETTHVDQRGKRLPQNPFIDEDRLIPGLRELAQSIKATGALACVQLCHGGTGCVSDITGSPPLGPSPIPCKVTHVSPKEGEMPEELTVEQIHRITEAFVAGAVRARKAGFDAVEVHGAHGYLISNFLSPDVNRRTDSYGGDIRNRTRFFEEIVRGIKEKIGSDFLVIARLNCRDYVEGGLEFPDSIVASQIVEKAGADAIHLSGGVHSSNPCIIAAPMSLPPGVFVEYAAQLKQHVDVPVITVNRIHDPVLAEEILERGDADMVAMGRALVADPQLPSKAMECNTEDIVPCVSCNECFGSIYGGRITCTVNPFAGRELIRRVKIGQKRSPKRVVVIGGGVAGMSCAITAAKLKHQITLFEQQPFLGGLLRIAYLAPNRDTLSRLLAYFERQLQKSGVEVILGKSLTLPEAQELAADVFVIATGATPSLPPIPGVDRQIVLKGIEALRNPGRVGQNCVIYGGGLLAVELADLLITQSERQIMLIVRSTILKKANFSDKLYYLTILRDFGIEVLQNTKIVEIRPASVVIEPPNHWRREILDVDTVVMATGWRPSNYLATDLAARGYRTVTVGDALEPRKLLNAIHEGTLSAFDI